MADPQRDTQKCNHLFLFFVHPLSVGKILMMMNIFNYVNLLLSFWTPCSVVWYDDISKHLFIYPLSLDFVHPVHPVQCVKCSYRFVHPVQCVKFSLDLHPVQCVRCSLDLHTLYSVLDATLILYTLYSVVNAPLIYTLYSVLDAPLICTPCIVS